MPEAVKTVGRYEILRSRWCTPEDGIWVGDTADDKVRFVKP